MTRLGKKPRRRYPIQPMLLHHALRLNLNPVQPDVVAIVGGGGKSSAAFRLALDLAAAGQRAVVTHTARIAAFQTAWAPAVIEVESAAAALPLGAIAGVLDRHGSCLLTGPVVGDRRAGLSPYLVDSLAAAGPQLGLHAISIEADGSKMRPAKAPAEHEPVLPAATTVLVPMLGLDAVGGVLSERLFHRAELVLAALQEPLRPDLLEAGDLVEVGRTRFTPEQAARLLISPIGGAKAQPPGAALLPIFNKADHPLRLLYGRLAAAHLARAGQPSLLGAVGAGAPWSTAEPGGATQTEAGAAGAPVLERWGQVAAIILAAGAAVRLGRPKQIELVAGEPLLLRALAVAAGVDGPVYVVTGAHRAAVLALLADLPDGLAARLRGRLHVIDNQDWATGQASSLHASIRALPRAVEAAIWLPVDQPYLEAGLLARLVSAWRRGAGLVAPLAGGEMRGAPALFDRRYWSELLQVTGDSGGRTVLRRFAGDVATVAVDPRTLHDIDTPDDLPTG